MEDELLYEDSRITVGESLLLTMAFIMRHKMSLCNCLGQILVKFLSDCISEPGASLLVVCVHGLCFCVCEVYCLYCEVFGSYVYNYSGVQRGQSVSMGFLPFLVSFRRYYFQSSCFAVSCVRVFITSNYCSSLSFRVAQTKYFYLYFSLTVLSIYIL